MGSKAEGKILTRNTFTSEEQCERHTGEMISFYCRSDDVLGCGTCMILNHRNCLLDYLPDIVETNAFDDEFKTFVAGLEHLSSDLCDIEKQSKANNDIIDSVHDNLVQELSKLKDDVMQNLKANTKELEDKLAILKEHDENNMIELQRRCSEYFLEVKELKSKSEKLKADGKVCQLYIIMKKSRCKLDNYAEMLSNTREECKLILRIKDCKLETEVNHSQIHLNMSSQRKDGSSKKSVYRSEVNQMLRRRGIKDMLHMVVPLVVGMAIFLLVRAWVSGNREAVLQSNMLKFPFGLAELYRLNEDCYEYDCEVTDIRCSNLRIRVHSNESLIISHLQRLYIDSDVVTEFNLHVFDLTAGMSTKHISREIHYGTEKALSIKNDNQVYRFSSYSKDIDTIAVLNISGTEIQLSNTIRFNGTFNCISVLNNNILLLTDSTVFIINANTWISERSISLHGLVKQLTYIQPSNDELALFAIDQTSETVVKFDLDGNVLDTYRHSSLRAPSELTLDRRGYVYVIGLESKNIHRLTPQLQLLQIIELKSKPFSISYSDIHNTLYVGLADECSFYIINIQHD